ncbi:uncharacterized protein LOC115885760 [Sitophilus oryzae]|uniref:Uncharacterized protein LOC115885760 n=1 Tax=Sitophilus oryzae TaxID=7048 RepID=A0A6J2YBR5_SITOR|nr:uncharacterized protein LOC115885760 [Sitophilus oryzae]
MDVVFNLINVKTFFKYSYNERLELKQKGRPLPDLVIEQPSSSKGKSYYTRKFTRDIYSKNNWICGCNRKNALYCFTCLLFGGGDKAWTQVGVTDLEHLTKKMKAHENSRNHLHNYMEFMLLGATDFKAQLNSAYWINEQRHKENVSKNRYVISKVINCIKFCGAFETVLLGHDEGDIPHNPGIVPGIIKVFAEIEATLSEHLKNSSVFNGSFRDIQNDLLQCMLEVCQEELAEEIKSSPFLAIMADETKDVVAKSQMIVIVFRYIRDGEPIERFWNYLIPAQRDARALSDTILAIVDPLIQDSPNKLIAQSYDGAAPMSDQKTGVQALIKEKYPFAHYVHCYAHQLKSIMSKAASTNGQVRMFFEHLQTILDFFNNSSQVAEVLNKIVMRKSLFRLDLNIRTINVVYENRKSLIECTKKIEDRFSNDAISSAAPYIRRTLNDPVFNFWLTFLHRVMLHIETLSNQLEERQIDPNLLGDCIKKFELSIVQIRENIDQIIREALEISDESANIKPIKPHIRVAAISVCHIIIYCAKDRFHFKEHLVVASLFFSENFGKYCGTFPEDKLTCACSCYPSLDKNRLRNELSMIYSRIDCRALNGALPFLKFILKNNLGDTLRETRKLLEIVLTIPMVTSENERCFSTLKQIKTFLSNSISEDRLNIIGLTALSVLSIEKKFITGIGNFNDRVIRKFANTKERRMHLIFNSDDSDQPNSSTHSAGKNDNIEIFNAEDMQKEGMLPLPTDPLAVENAGKNYIFIKTEDNLEPSDTNESSAVTYTDVKVECPDIKEDDPSDDIPYVDTEEYKIFFIDKDISSLNPTSDGTPGKRPGSSQVDLGNCPQKRKRTAVSEGESTKGDKSHELGKCWTTIHRKLLPEQQRIAERAIISILSEACRGKLNQNSVVINGVSIKDL